jgi:hypothetical protein
MQVSAYLRPAQRLVRFSLLTPNWWRRLSRTHSEESVAGTIVRELSDDEAPRYGDARHRANLIQSNSLLDAFNHGAIRR